MRRVTYFLSHFCFFPSCLQWASPIVKRHLLTNSFLPFPQDRKTLTFYLQEQGDNTRSIVIMWSSPNKRLKTESMCAGSGVTDPSSHSTSSDLQGLVSDLYSGDSQPPTMLPVLENVWGLINRTAAALTTLVRNHWLVPRLHSTRGQWAELQHQLRHPPRPRAFPEAFLILNYLWLFLLTQGISLLNPAKASINYKEPKRAHIWTHTHYTHKTREVLNLSHANIYIFKYFFVCLCQVWSICGLWFPAQGLNPTPLYWELGVLATGPLGKSPLANISQKWIKRVKFLKTIKRQSLTRSVCVLN